MVIGPGISDDFTNIFHFDRAVTEMCPLNSSSWVVIDWCQAGNRLLKVITWMYKQ